MCDQLRGQAIGCAGDSNVLTPNLDRLAADGTRFENAYSTDPVCVPARQTMLTGEYAHTSHVPSIGWQLPAEKRTIADEFDEAGYQTSWIGKWHLSDGIHNPQHATTIDGTDVAPVPSDLQGGFEHWRGFELRNGPFDTYYFADDDPTPRLVEGYQTDGLTDLALDFLDSERNTDRPFSVRSRSNRHIRHTKLPRSTNVDSPIGTSTFGPMLISTPTTIRPGRSILTCSTHRSGRTTR